MPPERSGASEDEQRIVPFRRPGSLSRARWPLKRTPDADAPVDDLAKYERGEEEDNYRHRMLVNVAALLFTVALALMGAWLALQLAEMRKNQDCVLSGRRNCTPIDINAAHR